MELEIRSSEIVPQENSESRIIEGRAIVFNSPSNEIPPGFIETVLPGAISQELVDSSDVFARMNHDDDYILARSRQGNGSLNLELKEDGLYYSFEAPKTEKGNELLEHIRRGEINQSSFAFGIDPEDKEAVYWVKEDGIYHRYIRRISYLSDVAPVFTPAYSATSCYTRMLEESKEIDSQMDLLAEPIREIPGNERCLEILELCKKEIRKMTESEEKEFNDLRDSLFEERACKNKEEREEDTIPEDPEKENEIEDTGDSPEDKEESQNLENPETETPLEEERAETNTINNINNNFIQTKMEFRLLSALNAIANNRSLDEASMAINEAGADELRKSGLNYNGGLMIPSKELRADISVATEGVDVVITDFKDILAPLYAKNVLVQAGAKFLTGLVGDVQIPYINKANVSWEGEIATPAADAGITFGNVKLQPKRLTAYMPVSLQFLAQDSLGAEAMIRQDLVDAINAKLEYTILSDNHATGSPDGIFYGQTATSITTFKDLTDIEAAVENAGVLGETKYIVSPAAKSSLRSLAKSAKTTQLVMENGEIDGIKALSTGNVNGAVGNIVYGDFSNLAIGQWGGIQLDVVRDSVSLKNGCVTIVVNAFFDAKVIRPAAFGFGNI